MNFPCMNWGLINPVYFTIPLPLSLNVSPGGHTGVSGLSIECDPPLASVNASLSLSNSPRNCFSICKYVLLFECILESPQ